MKLQEEIWDNEKHWFKWKVRFAFLFLGLALHASCLLAAYFTNGENIVIPLVLGSFGFTFYLLFLGPVIIEALYM